MPPRANAVRPADLVGPVHRTLLVTADGRRDTTTSVVWFQGPGLFVDLRLPAREPAGVARLAGPADLAGAPPEVLDALAAREGFGGRFTLDGDLARWERLVDLHPATGVPDEGTLVRRGGLLVETGVHAPYVEHWLPEPQDPDDAAAVLLAEPGTGRAGVVVRVGARFGVAVGRARPLTPGTDLGTLLRRAAPGERAGVLDAEVALGRVDPDGRWVVEVSSLPWRPGRDLAPADDGSTLTATCSSPHGAARRRWSVVDREGAALVPDPLQDDRSDLTPAGGRHGTA